MKITIAFWRFSFFVNSLVTGKISTCSPPYYLKRMKIKFYEIKTLTPPTTLVANEYIQPPS
jgi:hypothetical protein